ncbi:putative cyclic nucleotide-gated ion channel 9 [Hibiscus syriacus]|uniref:Cyclic nucleotide-gated ion channel 9 n=1 Tax=Hibiscus syriacus TaxID=106335 RepID=A0A6A2YXI7_HIBSY|nr:putative cyclic nucleotide-gated ion channel 9 [Hibiscus syriacus]
MVENPNLSSIQQQIAELTSLRDVEHILQLLTGKKCEEKHDDSHVFDKLPTPKTKEPETLVSDVCPGTSKTACPTKLDEVLDQHSQSGHAEQSLFGNSEINLPLSASFSNPHSLELHDEMICCILNSEDPEIQCNDDVFLGKGLTMEECLQAGSDQASSLANQKDSKEEVSLILTEDNLTQCFTAPKLVGLDILSESIQGVKFEFHDGQCQVISRQSQDSLVDPYRFKAAHTFPNSDADGAAEEYDDPYKFRLLLMGINLKDALVEVEKIIRKGSGFVAVEIPFTHPAKCILELSLEENHQIGHNYIESEHILLGLLCEGEAARVLENPVDIEEQEQTISENAQVVGVFCVLLNQSCPIQTPNTTLFNFGIFLDALKSGVVKSKDFLEKFFSVSGGSTTTRLEKMRVKRRDAEQWMSHRLLPESLRERIRRYEQYRVPMFEKMDEKLLDAMCDRLKPVLYTEESYIVREGDPVDEMFFIMRGKLLTMTTNGGRTGFFNSEYLGARDFCGEDLLTWALDPHSSSNLPISTRTVRALTEVEAFALMADDLKFVASQFRQLHSKQLRHTFRFYSQQWRSWAACFIQAAWRRYSKKKLKKVEERMLRGGGRDDAKVTVSMTVVLRNMFTLIEMRADADYNSRLLFGYTSVRSDLVARELRMSEPFGNFFFKLQMIEMIALIFWSALILQLPIQEPCLAIGFLPLHSDSLRVGQLVTLKRRNERPKDTRKSKVSQNNDVVCSYHSEASVSIFDPWGQGSIRGGGNVMHKREGREEEVRLVERDLGIIKEGLGIEEEELGIEAREGHMINLPNELEQAEWIQEELEQFESEGQYQLQQKKDKK